MRCWVIVRDTPCYGVLTNMTYHAPGRLNRRREIAAKQQTRLSGHELVACNKGTQPREVLRKICVTACAFWPCLTAWHVPPPHQRLFKREIDISRDRQCDCTSEGTGSILELHRQCDHFWSIVWVWLEDILLHVFMSEFVFFPFSTSSLLVDLFTCLLEPTTSEWLRWPPRCTCSIPGGSICKRL